MSSVPRGKLIGMQVYNPDGSLVGTVSDIELAIGGGEISLQVMSRYNVPERVPWSMVAAAGDIIILKEKIELKQPEAPAATTYIPPAAQPTPQQPRPGIFSSVTSRLPLGRKEKAACPTCGKELTWIEQYQRWYCYNCGKYA
ncbi:MAG: PRC-barrel domain-containing protein [Candidatus Caldarchaeum sp.]|uniref:PRC-barrel domain-containing protein n=1 Tax=Caldiarchaeum subterraneum TaxID=311458 RepID=A0A7C5LC25_CALS0